MVERTLRIRHARTMRNLQEAKMQQMFILINQSWIFQESCKKIIKAQWLYSQWHLEHHLNLISHSTVATFLKISLKSNQELFELFCQQTNVGCHVTSSLGSGKKHSFMTSYSVKQKWNKVTNVLHLHTHVHTVLILHNRRVHVEEILLNQADEESQEGRTNGRIGEDASSPW